MYQPFSFIASSFIPSKSFTFGFLKVASAIPPSIPTPKTGFSAKNGAVIVQAKIFSGCAKDINVIINVQLQFTKIQYKKVLSP